MQRRFNEYANDVLFRPLIIVSRILSLNSTTQTTLMQNQQCQLLSRPESDGNHKLGHQRPINCLLNPAQNTPSADGCGIRRQRRLANSRCELAGDHCQSEIKRQHIDEQQSEVEKARGLTEKHKANNGAIPGNLKHRKRQTICTSSGEDDDHAPESGGQNADLSLTPGIFLASASVKCKGRTKPKESERLNWLLEAILVKDLALARKTISHSLNVTNALPVLASIEEADLPSWSATSIYIAGINTYIKARPSERDACNMGVSIKRLGTPAERDLITTRAFYNETPKLDVVCDLCSWNTLPASFNNCATVYFKAFLTRLKTVNVNKALPNRFSKAVRQELALSRCSE
ncbi:hypothetical protein GN958_ATG09543 [Phytophthora infestans]|uniref:Uncharacterized protein n=1 Tax=Phytophthora infestans TaxID=4787 RepID=A0A8S9USV9_PHYIN|nr:hypothetical protein GN958_ATG09543 [Phytophthora infestans]